MIRWYLILAYFVGPVALIFLILARNRKIDKAIYLICRSALMSYPVLIIICIVSGTHIALTTPAFSEKDRNNIKRTWYTSSDICVALKAYFDEHKHHPDLLDQLVPKYLKEIQAPKIGDTGWMYRKNDSKVGFALEIGYDSYCGLSYPVVYNYVNRSWRRRQAGENN